MQESSHMPREQMEKNELEIQRFREEIARLKAAERETVHLRDIDPGKLVEEDAYVYQLYLDGTLDENIFETYRRHAQDRGSRTDFAAYLGNMLMIQQYEKYLSAEAKKKTA